MALGAWLQFAVCRSSERADRFEAFGVKFLVASLDGNRGDVVLLKAIRKRK